MWRRATAYLVGFLIVAGACAKPPVMPQQGAVERYIADPNSVGFDIVPLQGENGSSLWLATYSEGGKKAIFKIEIGQARELDDKDSKALGIKTGEGRFASVPGSDASVLLVDLRKALEANRLPVKAKRVPELSFTFVSFGERQSQATDGGGFNADPPGNWTPMKIFLGQGDSEGEALLNLNPVIRRGQFSIKDPDYGDLVLAQLAKVL